MPVKAKRLEFEVGLDAEGGLSAEGCSPLHLPDEWTAEHLLLAALARCSLTSLRYHAKRAGISVSAEAAASGLVTKRESDGRYAFLELACRVSLELDPEPRSAELAELLAKAERDCFIGASLSTPTRYTWSTNGREVTSAG